MSTLSRTKFNFPGQIGKVYHGKVRDVYNIEGDILVMITTDAVSAFDVVLPRGIPFKGQVLNLISLKFLEATKGRISNWVLSSPHPNVIIGKKLEPFMVEMIMRGYLTGSSWRLYKAGGREICGLTLPEGLREHEAFSGGPILTPTTKAAQGDHDEDISEEEIIDQGLVSEDDYDLLASYSKELFAFGQREAVKMGLILVDTKYEFGKDKTNLIHIIDEIHTPDSSRYFTKESYDEYVASGYDPNKAPKPLSKEFLREWLMERGFKGEEGQEVPKMTDEFVLQVSERYIELYEKVTDEKFEGYPVDEKEIFDSVVKALEELK